MKRFLALLASLVAIAEASASDWPQWRGLARNGISPEPLSTNWPATGPNLLWRASVGTGFSGVSINAGRAFTLGNTTNHDTVWCFDSLTGKELWRHTYPAQLGPQYYEGGPGATPTVASNRVFTISKWGDVFCLDTATGAIIWQHDLRKDSLKPNRWGFAGSPLLWHDLVILNAGSAGIALDHSTGRLVWCNGTNAGGYASPTLFPSHGEEAVLIFAAKHLVALAPQTGHELWRHFWETGWDTNNTDPLVDGDHIFISSFTRGCALLSLTTPQLQVVYDTKILHNHLSPGILLGEYLYAFNGEAHQETDLRCIHLLTGQLKWTRKDPPFGSLICAAGKLLFLSENGELLLADASPLDFKPLARAKVLAGVCWTSPTLAHGLLYIRTAKGELHCLDLRPTS